MKVRDVTFKEERALKDQQISALKTEANTSKQQLIKMKEVNNTLS
jgi:hypothetical protein